MPKIKKIKKIPSKIKEIKVLKEKTDLENTISEEEKFIETSSGGRKIISPVIRKSPSQGQSTFARNVPSQEALASEEIATRKSYFHERTASYENTASARSGRNVYNTTIQPTATFIPVNTGNVSNTLDQRRIIGNKGIGNQSAFANQEQDDRGSNYQSGKKKREVWEGG